jgi:hypothetical protein
MYNRHHLLRLLVFSFILMIGNSFNDNDPRADALTGAWKLKNGQVEQILVFIDNYYTHTTYSQQEKKFAGTRGGTYSLSGDQIVVAYEFNSSQKSEVGTKATYKFSISGDRLNADIGGKSESWTRVDKGTGPLAGNWQITGRMQGDKMNEMRPGARKTIKILSGSRFQWAAINTETAEFSGTGGGTYTFQNGKYTENIEFFSRDSSRIGAKLSFDGAVEDGKWIHKGLSSRGEKIHEIWSRATGTP